VLVKRYPNRVDFPFEHLLNGRIVIWTVEDSGAPVDALELCAGVTEALENDSLALIVDKSVARYSESACSIYEAKRGECS